MPRSIKIMLCCLLLIAGVTIGVSGVHSFFTFREGGMWWCSFTEDGQGAYIPEALPWLRRTWYGTKAIGGILLAIGGIRYLVALRRR
jgi:hypothetical protein